MGYIALFHQLFTLNLPAGPILWTKAFKNESIQGQRFSCWSARLFKNKSKASMGKVMTKYSTRTKNV